jgi:transcriptional regulator with XRE-family HTH domain
MAGKDLRELLSRNIKLYRNHHSWSQAVLAEKADISIAFLSNIERGLKWPYPDTLSNIAEALEIEVFELFKRENEESDETAELLIDRLVRDISASVNNSIAKTHRRYRRGAITSETP